MSYTETSGQSALTTGPGCLPTPQQYHAHKILVKYEALRITGQGIVEDSEPLIKMNGISVATRQNLMVLSGPSKGGKSAIVSLLCAGSMAGPNGYDGCAAIQIAPNTANHAVLHFDTEQCRAQQDSNIKNAVLKRAGLQHSPDYFHSLTLLEKDHNECKDVVKEMFEAAFELHKGIHLAIIDGVADFIQNVNKEDETKDIVAFFRGLSVQYNTAVVLVIHQNPGSEKERGHLGSELQRKCESMLVIDKDEKLNRSCLQAKFLRQGDCSQFKEIGYKFSAAKGYHVFDGEETFSQKQIDLMQLARKVFTEPLRYSQVMDKMIELKVGKASTVKRRMDDLKKERFIIKQQQEGKDTLYLLNPEVVN